MNKKEELMQSIEEMEAAIKADATTKKFLEAPLTEARKQLETLEEEDKEPLQSTVDKVFKKTTAKKIPAKKTIPKKQPPKKKATTTSKALPIDFDWKKTYKGENFKDAHFKADFQMMKLEKDSKVRLYPSNTSVMVKKGHYLVLNPQGRPFTVISPSMVGELTASGMLSEKMVTKATNDKWKAKAEKLEGEIKKAKVTAKPKKEEPKKQPQAVSTPAKAKTKTEQKAKPSTTGIKRKGAASCQVTKFTGDLPQPLFRYLLEQATLYQEAAKKDKFKANERIFKILKVYQRNDKAGELVAQLKIETPFKKRLMGIKVAEGTKPEIGYFNLCVNRGLSTTKRPSNFEPRKKEWTKIADERLMNNMYSPGQGKTVNKCRDLAAKAFASDGGIENKKAWESHRNKCTNKGAVEIGQKYVKWLHEQTKKNRKEGEEYYEAMQRVIDDIRAKRS